MGPDRLDPGRLDPRPSLPAFHIKSKMIVAWLLTPNDGFICKFCMSSSSLEITKSNVLHV